MSKERHFSLLSCTGDRDQDHSHRKEMQKSKMAVWGGMINSCKQGDNTQHTPFPIWNQSVVPHPVLTAASWPAYRFLSMVDSACCRVGAMNTTVTTITTTIVWRVEEGPSCSRGGRPKPDERASGA